MEKKDNLLLLVPSLAIGGQERQAVMMADCLKEDYNVSIIVFSTVVPAYKATCKVIDINLPPVGGRIGKLFQQLRRAYILSKLRMQKKPIAIYSFGTTANLTNILSCGPGKRIVSIRSADSTKKSMLLRAIYKRADRIVCQTQAMRGMLIKRYRGIAAKTRIVYNAYDIDAIRLKAQEKPEHLLPQSPFILAIGRMDRQKGFCQLLRAFALLLKKIPDVLLILGGDGEIKEDVLNLIDDLRIQANTICTGLMMNPYPYMSRCECFVLPSIAEGFPNTLAEAMICGAPVIAADCKTGPREILSEQYTNIPTEKIEYAEYGILVPPFISDESEEHGKSKILADAIYQIISNEEMREQYSGAATKRIEIYSTVQFREKIVKMLLE